MSKDNLGDRIKEKYEDAYRIFLPGRMPVILRLDGKSFHTLTANMQRPWDDHFNLAMVNTTKYLCENIQGCVLGYTQSDEISLVIVNYKRFNSESWFDNNLQKIVSVSAALATLAFNKELVKYYPDKEGVFDSRAFVVPKEEVCNAILFRQNDATRNSIQMLARAHFSHKELYKLNNSQIQDKLMLEKGINWNDTLTHRKRGACVRKNEENWVIDLEPPIFSKDRNYINDLLVAEEE